MAFAYYNPNPVGVHIRDCTVRALCVVLRIDWDTAHKMLADTSRSMGLIEYRSRKHQRSGNHACQRRSEIRGTRRQARRVIKEDEMEHKEHLEKIKKMVEDLLGRFAKEDAINERDIATVKEAVSAYQKLCDLCEEGGEGYGARGPRYGARRRDSRGRYMTGRGMDGYGMGGGYGWMPATYYDGPYYDGPAEHGELAEELERMAQDAGISEADKTAFREAARRLRQG